MNDTRVYLVSTWATRDDKTRRLGYRTLKKPPLLQVASSQVCYCLLSLFFLRDFPLVTLIRFWKLTTPPTTVALILREQKCHFTCQTSVSRLAITEWVRAKAGGVSEIRLFPLCTVRCVLFSTFAGQSQTMSAMACHAHNEKGTILPKWLLPHSGGRGKPQADSRSIYWSEQKPRVSHLEDKWTSQRCCCCRELISHIEWDRSLETSQTFQFH